MTGHLYLHLGPPKSGTTSLQYAFDRLEHPNFVYGGVYQPRERNAGSLANRLHESVKTQGADPQVVRTAAREVRSLIAEGKQVLISEEMFLLTQGNQSWKQKLALLSECFRDVPTTVIISLRNPLEGIPSLYQEIFNVLPFAYKLEFGRFCESEIAECYDFQQVGDELHRLGFDRIQWVTFEAIRKGNIGSTDLFGGQDILQLSEIPIGHANTGAKKQGGKQRNLKGVTLKALGQIAVVRSAVEKLGLRSFPAYHRTTAWLDRITIRPAGYRTLMVPEHAAKRFRTGYEKALSRLEDWQPPADTAAADVGQEAS